MKRRFIGISGGIGAGKSVVSRILRLKGYGVYDCDFEASKIMNGSEMLCALSSRFGEEVVTAEGKLNRPLLALIIFSDESDRLWVNSLVHSHVMTDLLRWGEKSRLNRFVESAILAESGLAKVCENILFVDASESDREDRAFIRKVKSASGKIDEDSIRTDIRKRIASQRKEEADLKTAGVPIQRIDNSGSLPLLSQIETLLGIYKHKIMSLK